MPFILKLLIAIVAFLVLYSLSVRMVRGMLRPAPPDEPDLSTLRPVDYRYRCTVCGAEVTMTASPEAEPDAPRHCREDMQIVSS